MVLTIATIVEVNVNYTAPAHQYQIDKLVVSAHPTKLNIGYFGVSEFEWTIEFANYLHPRLQSHHNNKLSVGKRKKPPSAAKGSCPNIMVVGPYSFTH